VFVIESSPTGRDMAEHQCGFIWNMNIIGIRWNHSLALVWALIFLIVGGLYSEFALRKLEQRHGVY
jgi:hypothetical protein